MTDEEDAAAMGGAEADSGVPAVPAGVAAQVTVIFPPGGVGSV